MRTRSRKELVSRLEEENRAMSMATVFFHHTVAERLGLNPTDHKCLDLIMTATKAGLEPLTPGQIARLSGLTSGAVTGVLDRLEAAGFVQRRHDAEDRRRIIVAACPEPIKEQVAPRFVWLSEGFEKLCEQYSDQELEFLADFATRCIALLREATTRLRDGDASRIE